MRKALIALTVVVVVVGVAPAAALVDIVIIDVDTVVRGSEGTIKQVAEVPVDAALVGATCTGTAQTENNSSEHPNNDFILASGGSTAEIPNYEAVAGQITEMTTPLVLGDVIIASIRLGPDHVASQGVRVTLACTVVPPPETTTTTAPPPETTTTTAPPPETTTTAAPPTTTTTTAPPATTTTGVPEVTTTTEEPPEGGVSAGGGSTALAPDDRAAWWVGAGTLTLLGALVTVAAARGRLSSED